jgi:catechol 2,3-dioxygenase-like lactoylglutathione lyase family enzyme
MAVGRLTQLVLECDDAERLARFWQEVLGLPQPEGDSDWAWRVYADPAGHPFCLVSVPE